MMPAANNPASSMAVETADQPLPGSGTGTSEIEADGTTDRTVGSAIALSHISFAYPDTLPVLHDLSLTVQPGERVGIIGHNGCGKTTLFHLLCGVLCPTTGEISVLGRRLVPGQFYPEVGLLFQDPDDQLFSASVQEDIAFGPLNMGLSPEGISQRVQQAIQITGIAALAERPPHHLSGGEKQMVAIAGLLAMHPQILLYDEPTANLDLRARRRLIQFLQQSSQTLLMASHDLECVLEVCDRTLLFHQGQLIADGPSRDLMGDEALMLSHGLERPYSLAVGC